MTWLGIISKALLSPLGKVLAAILAVSVMAGGIYLYGHQRGRMAEQAVFAQWTNQQNEDAGNAAEDWRARYRRCAERGGVFDYETGSCHE
ncbi:hypothetical protein JYP46_01840 [Nitratireductor aquimarinus]|uniref:hypothetical protein n=1 Tax=Alphaproteobacteria TaxID=28211 RepID=UPI0019D37633|nr:MULTISPECIES: hypothetical protein [Alphaproteobacteria]MBN7755552.1 hypothetical protein [Nitratireductor aquimarinus]MBY5998307.1 hypothetical protein [Tritonibacter mobilis]MBY6020338.1 hypothetical protein [Nitratireductor sp. DP7N14-4]